MYGNIGRNYLKYGYLATQLGPVSSLGSVTPSEFEYYYHYPPLLYWLVSLSFKCFGVAEWSARLVPLAFSVATLILIYLIGARLFDRRVALLATAFAAIMPMEAYYGAHLDVYGPVAVAFSLLGFYGYIRWLRSRRTKDLSLCVAGVVFGCMTSWFTYFLIPLILAHHFWFHYWRERNARDLRLLILPVSAIGVFAFFISHRKWLLRSNSEVAGSLGEKFFQRISFGEDPMHLMAKHFGDVLNFYTLPLSFLAVAWAGFFVRDLFKKQLQESDWLLLVLLGYGVLHNIVFPGLLDGHNYMARCYTPALALGAALASLRILAFAGKAAPPQIVTAAAYFSFALIVACGIQTTSARFGSDYAAWFYELRRTGQSIHAAISDRDLVLMPVADDVLNYYIDRPVRAPVTTLAEVLEISRQRDGRCFYACPAPQVDSITSLITELDMKFPRIRRDDPIIFALDAQSGDQ